MLSRLVIIPCNGESLSPMLEPWGRTALRVPSVLHRLCDSAEILSILCGAFLTPDTSPWIVSPVLIADPTSAMTDAATENGSAIISEMMTIARSPTYA